MEIPLLVPGLTKQEISLLLSGAKPTDVVMRKAVGHAKNRMFFGKSPFAQEGEQKPFK